MSDSTKIKATINLNGVESTHEVSPTFQDMARWDIVRAKNNWPSSQDAVTLFAGTLIYSALVRQGVVPNSLAVDKFIMENVVSVEPIEDESEAADFPLGSTK